MRISTSFSLVLFHQMFTLVAHVNSQTTSNVCSPNSVTVEDKGSAYSGVRMYFGDSFCQRMVQQDLTNALQSACPAISSPPVPSAEYQSLTAKIDSLEKRAYYALQRLTAVILSTNNKTCRTGYDYYEQGRFCYKFYMDCKPWLEARQVCQLDGGDLISLNDGNFEYFRSLSRSKTGMCSNAWVGATDAALEGRWNWLNGDAISTGFWGYQQPDNWASKENCADLNKVFDYKLNDEDCNNRNNFICRSAQ